jgi:uncharacterized protein
MTVRLTGIITYPIKSARGVRVDDWEVDDFGLRYDRRWMVVDDSGQFLSQRSHPTLALAVPSLHDGVLQVTAPGMPTLETPLNPASAVTTSVRIWRDRVDASWAGEAAARWFSEFLDSSCSLVHMPSQVRRPTNPAYAPGSRVSFADAYPFLLLSEESLADLNRRLGTPLPMNRFRPNLVVAGAEPYAEDRWERLVIGNIRFRVVKPCDRCLITTTDQATAQRGKEPLQTLATYRKVGGEVMFGQNVVHEETGRLSVGEAVLMG